MYINLCGWLDQVCAGVVGLLGGLVWSAGWL